MIILSSLFHRLKCFTFCSGLFVHFQSRTKTLIVPSWFDLIVQIDICRLAQRTMARIQCWHNLFWHWATHRPPQRKSNGPGLTWLTMLTLEWSIQSEASCSRITLTSSKLKLFWLTLQADCIDSAFVEKRKDCLSWPAFHEQPSKYLHSRVIWEKCWLYEVHCSGLQYHLFHWLSDFL